MGERTAQGGGKKITAKPRPHPKHTQIQHSLLGFGAVGVINHHSSCKSSSHRLGCDELQLRKAAGAKVN